MFAMKLYVVSFWLVLTSLCLSYANADVGVLSFWIPELRALLSKIEQDGSSVETHIIGPRKFYVTNYKGHNLVICNTGVGISNAAIATTMLLTHFPSVTRLVGSGVAGGIDPSLRVGDVIVPDRWAMYQHQLFAKEVAPDTYEPPVFELDILVGPNCGGFDGIDTYLTGPAVCNVSTTEPSNFEFIFPKSIPTPNPNAAEEINQISEGNARMWWFEVDADMFAIASDLSPELANEANGAVLDYTPTLSFGGPGLSGSTFLDNAEYREYLFTEFEARAVDMETAAAAHTAEQFGKPYIFFRSLSDLAGADQDQNVIGVFFSVAAMNAVTTLSLFLENLPVSNESDDLPVPLMTKSDNTMTSMAPKFGLSSWLIGCSSFAVAALSIFNK